MADGNDTSRVEPKDEAHSLSEPIREDVTPHILVVDDDTRIRALIAAYLRENGFRASVAADAGEARALMAGLDFDLIVLDVMMPEETGFELTRFLRGQAANDIPILLLTARGDPDDRITGLEAGADDYLPKPFEPRELLLRISTILRRARPGARLQKTVQIGAVEFDLGTGELKRQGETVHLTAAEAALLRLFAANPGTVFSRTELCERSNAGLERSVDVQINRLRRKIESNARAPVFLQTVRGVGYVLRLER